MDYKLSDNWLREFLKTKAKTQEIGDQLALSGPSVEKIRKEGNDYIYDIEVTTNRVDCMSVIGVAREANAIIEKSQLQLPAIKSQTSKHGSDKLKIKIDKNLANRVMAVVMEVKIKDTPKIMKERLENSGMRSLISIVDITNYVMLEIGHPTHVFDFDKVENGILNFRLSKKGEQITTFNGTNYKLSGEDIVIDNGNRKIIDLPGIIGLSNSVPDKNTKRIIFFIDNNDKDKIRKTSTRLGIRTNAAILNEKGVDPELAELAFYRGIELYKKLCDAKVISKLYDIYPTKYKAKTLTVEHKFIEKIIGIEIPTLKVISILEKLGFEIKVDKKKSLYSITVPSWRANDVTIPEDIVEEVARIYGYHNLPTEIMSGKLPKPVLDTPFDFENKIKSILKGFGGIEVYTNSLVSKEFADEKALTLKNPLGEDTKYLRTSLKPSLISVVKNNAGEIDPYYLFEIANIYLPRKGTLPEERINLGITFANFDFRKAKGIVEALIKELNIEVNITLDVVEDGKYFYWECDVNKLYLSKKERVYNPVSKYPAQIEDITLTMPEKTKIGEVLKVFKRAELKDVFKDSYTFKVWYESNEKTLTDKDVEKIRNRYLKEIKEKFGGIIKS